MDVIYLIIDKELTLENSPVLQSQVLDWLLIQKKDGVNVSLICTTKNKAAFTHSIGTLLDKYQIPHKALSHNNLVRNLLVMAVSLRRYSKKNKSTNVYVRGIWGAIVHKIAFITFGRKRPNLIYDFRGDLLSESLQINRYTRIKIWLLDRIISWSINRANKLSSVSNSGRDFICQKYKRCDSIVIPSCVNYTYFSTSMENRSPLRNKLNISDTDTVIAYAGGLNVYQMVPEMLEIWGALQSLKNIKFLLMTSSIPNIPPIKHRLEKIMGERIRILNLTRKDVPSYLASSDISFMLRNDDQVNQVASPLKLGEYLASGLPVVTSPGIGESSQLVSRNRLGILIPPIPSAPSIKESREFISYIKDNKNEYSSRSRYTARTKLDWSAQLPKWKALLEINSID